MKYLSNNGNFHFSSTAGAVASVYDGGATVGAVKVEEYTGIKTTLSS